MAQQNEHWTQTQGALDRILQKVTFLPLEKTFVANVDNIVNLAVTAKTRTAQHGILWLNVTQAGIN